MYLYLCVYILELEGSTPETDANGDPIVYAAGEQFRDIYGNLVFDVNGDPVFAGGGEPVIGIAQLSIDLGNTNGGATTFVRNVTAVPEPETYAMLLAGLGLVGWRIRGLRG